MHDQVKALAVNPAAGVDNKPGRARVRIPGKPVVDLARQVADKCAVQVGVVLRVGVSVEIDERGYILETSLFIMWIGAEL
jgi:hypothetical protein